MKLQKTCPSCGTANAETEFFCGTCGADISAVTPFDPTHTATEARRQPPTREQKKCPKCGLENEPYAFVCSQPGCGERLDDATTPRDQAPATSRTAVPATPLETARRDRHPKKLLLVVGSNTFDCKNGDILGRNGTLANHVFLGIPTISGHHVALELRGEQWLLVNLPLQPGKTAKNATVLDGREIPVGESVALTGEHILKISSRCEVKLSLR
jgi:ribosomal protein S27AE